MSDSNSCTNCTANWSNQLYKILENRTQTHNHISETKGELQSHVSNYIVLKSITNRVTSISNSNINMANRNRKGLRQVEQRPTAHNII